MAKRLLLMTTRLLVLIKKNLESGERRAYTISRRPSGFSVQNALLRRIIVLFISVKRTGCTRSTRGEGRHAGICCEPEGGGWFSAMKTPCVPCVRVYA
ncbi:MAG: hypothetical protein LBO67_00810 [Spirochaetaceae bacterium]|nr:hypothetical protein [Spirochaetaceae bacterium]